LLPGAGLHVQRTRRSTMDTSESHYIAETPKRPARFGGFPITWMPTRGAGFANLSGRRAPARHHKPHGNEKVARGVRVWVSRASPGESNSTSGAGVVGADGNPRSLDSLSFAPHLRSGFSRARSGGQVGAARDGAAEAAPSKKKTHAGESPASTHMPASTHKCGERKP